MRNKDLTGQRFGRLVVLEAAPTIAISNNKNKYYWKCLCDCGNTKVVCSKGLLGGNTKSCGCLKDEALAIIQQSKRKPNRYEIKNDYVIMYTSKNEPFYIDLEDLDRVKEYNWFVHPNGYLMTNDNHYRLHRLIMNITDPTIRVDHINHNCFDNRKINLRLTNASTNTMNAKVRINNSSGVTGVTWLKDKNKWRATITINYKTISLGHYINFDDAVAARKAAEEKYFGEYSYDNSMRIAEQIKIG